MIKGELSNCLAMDSTSEGIADYSTRGFLFDIFSGLIE
jgi:hypothetical protein